MLLPKAACSILEINVSLDTINDALNVDDFIVLLGDTNNTCRSLTTPKR